MEFLSKDPGTSRRETDGGGIPEAGLANPLRCACEIARKREKLSHRGRDSIYHDLDRFPQDFNQQISIQRPPQKNQLLSVLSCSNRLQQHRLAKHKLL